MLHAIERLRTVRDRCLAGEPLDQELAVWLGGRLNDVLHRESESFEDAFGLRGPKGGMPWWKEEQIRHRDKALRDLAATLPPDLSARSKAREVQRMTIRYGASAWRRDRDKPEMPAVYEGKPHAYLWAAFQSGAPLPLGERQLRNILAGV